LQTNVFLFALEITGSDSLRILTEQGPMEYRAVWMEGDKVVMIDQRDIPDRFHLVEFSMAKAWPKPSRT
jgi:hypothetical protein